MICCLKSQKQLGKNTKTKLKQLTQDATRKQEAFNYLLSMIPNVKENEATAQC